MNSDVMNSLRGKLQTRYETLCNSNFQTFHSSLIQVWKALQQNEITRSILSLLEHKHQELQSFALSLKSECTQELPVLNTEEEQAAISYSIIKWCVSSNDKMIEIEYGYFYTINRGCNSFDEGLDDFRNNYVRPLFNYIDEQISDTSLILILLIRFKHKCEWFNRLNLLSNYKSKSELGEKALSKTLYEYLYNEGINFYLEPKSELDSPSGRVDMISEQKDGNDRLLADAKIFDAASKDKSYIKAGFRQLYDYTNHHNQNLGYLIIFKVCQRGLDIDTGSAVNSTQYIQYGGKTIYILVIDIYDYPDHPSERNALSHKDERPIRITKQEFITHLEEYEQVA